MDPIQRSAFGVRARIVPVAAAIALAVICSQSGCRHKRNALRPVIVGPASTMPCPSGDCGGAAPVTVEPGFSDPAALTSPAPAPTPYDAGVSDEFAPDTGASAPPATPPDADATRTSGEETEPAFEGPTSSTSRQSNRPRFEGGLPRGSRPAPRNDLYDDSIPPEATQGPALEGPSSSRTTLRARPATSPPRRRGLFRRNLQAYVNDPDDLFTPPRADRPWRYIVLHHSAHPEGGLARIDRDHRDRLGTAGCGYHFVVGNGSESPDGRIEVAQRWSEQKGGQHCRDSRVNDINEYGIGICLIGNLDEAGPTAKQVESSRELIAYLQERYSIPAGNVVTHDVVAKSAAACPGKHFPRQALLGRDSALSARASETGGTMDME